ncbi:MAG: PstS family phosphate ABC transporter substrate-binding protein [Leptolyngbyaceae cyanobacterium bins.349]|nr:PstS family phosphate ABC transporter substrate-binding protein [Leptolyngbyaceae cyanobacterium bins.349]
MSQKSEIPALIMAFLVTVGLVSGGIWWLMQALGGGLGGLFSTNPSNSGATPTTAARFAEVQSVPSGLFNYGGSTTWAPIRRDVDAVIRADFPNFTLRYTDPITGTPGSSSGIRMLLEGQLALSQSSRPVKPEEYQQAQQRGFTLRQVPVAIEGIAIAVHPSLPIPGLNLTQLRDIYIGKVTNWNQVGGPDLPITPYSRRVQDGGTVEFFVENVLSNQAFGGNVQTVYSTTDALRKLSNNPGGIYYGSAPEVVPQCTVKPIAIARQGTAYVPPYQEPLVPSTACPAERNQFNYEAFKTGTYPITRQLSVVIKQNGQPEQQAGEAYANLLLTNQGQELIDNAGFVRIR